VILGASVLVASQHFASLFLGLEILSVSLYTLISYPSQQRSRIEAGIKYLVLAGTTSAFLLFGIALVYAVTGSLAFAGVAATSLTMPAETLLLVGLAMLIVGMGFELALVPFQWWTPDVYQGAPAPVTALIATVSKGAMFALMLRFFTIITLVNFFALWQIFAGIALVTMLFGNLVAVVQHNVKRILAYSSIAHLGYLLVAFLAVGSYARFAVGFYLAAYFITTLVVFGVITVRSTYEHEIENLDDYRGLFYQRPVLALVFSVGLLSLAGIPPTVGIIGKIFLAAAGVQSQLWVLLITLIVGSIIGVFYYLRIIVTMFRREEQEAAAPLQLPSQVTSSGLLLGVLFLLLLGLGLYPVPLMSLVSKLIPGL
jgi:NADH-quinone oxidoreductase subunit N